MIVLLHVLIALGSVGWTTYAFFAPTERKLQASYVLVALTVLSGTYLAILHPSHLLEVCTVGLVYTGAVTVGIIQTRRKLAAVHSNKSDI